MAKRREDRPGGGRESISTTKRIPWHIFVKIDDSQVLECMPAWSDCRTIAAFLKDSDGPDGGESDGAR